MNYVTRIAKVDQNERKNAIVEILKELRLPYIRQNAVFDDYSPENIIVSLNPSPSRLVIGAHWDSVKESTGANDNAAACAILLHLADALRDTDKSIDFVFFDREEYGGHGSRAYVQWVGRENMAAMVNMDVCGYGDEITMAAKGNVNSPVFGKLLSEKHLEAHAVNVLKFLPHGDDDRFEEAGVPNISVCMLSKSDLDFFHRMDEKRAAGEELSAEDNAAFMALDILATMHLRAKDHLETVSQKSMDILYRFVYEGLCDSVEKI